MSNKINKTKAVKEYLERHGKIDTWIAITQFHATRLSGIIYRLRRSYGMNIHSTEHKGDFAVYTLIEESA